MIDDKVTIDSMCGTIFTVIDKRVLKRNTASDDQTLSATHEYIPLTLLR
jgi:hypothetical protein